MTSLANRRALTLMRRRIFVQAYLENGGDAGQALIDAGYPVTTRKMVRGHSMRLFRHPQVQEMLKAQTISRNGIEQDRIHEEIKKLHREALSRYQTARDRQMDSDPERAIKWEEQTNRRFQLLLQAAELMLESATKHMKFRMSRGLDNVGKEDKTVNLVQNVVIVDRKSEEAKKVHEGAHEALDITPSRVVDAG